MPTGAARSPHGSWHPPRCGLRRLHLASSSAAARPPAVRASAAARRHGSPAGRHGGSSRRRASFRWSSLLADCPGSDEPGPGTSPGRRRRGRPGSSKAARRQMPSTLPRAASTRASKASSSLRLRYRSRSWPSEQPASDPSANRRWICGKADPGWALAMVSRLPTSGRRHHDSWLPVAGETSRIFSGWRGRGCKRQLRHVATSRSIG